MNRLFFTLVLSFFLLLLPGCSRQDTPEPVVTVAPDTNTGSNISVLYPELNYPGADTAQLQQLLETRIDQWIGSNFVPDSVIHLQGNITLQNDSLLCILFEGNAASPETAHPSRIAFSVCVDPEHLTTVDPICSEILDEGFVSGFLAQLSAYQDPNYTSEQWAQIAEYVGSFSTEELTAMIASSPIALSADGVTVCLNVPHAIGDYIKITVPIQLTDSTNPAEPIESIPAEPNGFSAFGGSIEFNLSDKGEFYELYQQVHGTSIYYRIWDTNASTLDFAYYEKDGRFSQIGDLLEFSMACGTSCRWVKYYDTANSRISRFFNNPLDVNEELVVYTKIINGDHCFVIQNIFDPTVCYKVIEMDPKPNSAVQFEAAFIDSLHIQVTYPTADGEFSQVYDIGSV